MNEARLLAWVLTQLPLDWALGAPVREVRTRTTTVIHMLSGHEGAFESDTEIRQTLGRLKRLEGRVKGTTGGYRQELVTALAGIADLLAVRVVDIRWDAGPLQRPSGLRRRTE